MYTLLGILGAAACVYLLVASIVIVRKQHMKNTTLDKDASLTTVKHPIIANPIFIFYVIVPVVTIAIAMILIFLTKP
ncbi:hypothetical protein [Cohnella boryungensis]